MSMDDQIAPFIVCQTDAGYEWRWSTNVGIAARSRIYRKKSACVQAVKAMLTAASKTQYIKHHARMESVRS